jgi:hypothetical protein
MNAYTLQVGRGGGDRIRALEQAVPLGARDIVEAINKAKHVINSQSWRPDSNVVCLVECRGNNERVVWTRPMIVARDM